MLLGGVRWLFDLIYKGNLLLNEWVYSENNLKWFWFWAECRDWTDVAILPNKRSPNNVNVPPTANIFVMIIIIINTNNVIKLYIFLR